MVAGWGQPKRIPFRNVKITRGDWYGAIEEMAYDSQKKIVLEACMMAKMYTRWEKLTEKYNWMHCVQRMSTTEATVGYAFAPIAVISRRKPVVEICCRIKWKKKRTQLCHQLFQMMNEKEREKNHSHIGVCGVCVCMCT